MSVADLDTSAVEARKVAVMAAAHAGVRIELVHDMDLLVTVRDVIDEVWRPKPDDRPVTLGVLRAMTHAGNYCALAWDGAEPIGVCVGFLGLGRTLTLHSHIAGVTPHAQGRSIGRAVKLDQRAWALEHGVQTITWTYDPLVRRNAYFNAARLGALPTEYLVDFYGDMTDRINAGQHTDRFAVTWDLASERVAAICTDWADWSVPAAPAASDERRVLLDVDPDTDEPVTAEPGPWRGGWRVVRVPADIESMRVTDPARALRWRLAARTVLTGLLDDGWAVRWVERDGSYVLGNNDEVRP